MVENINSFIKPFIINQFVARFANESRIVLQKSSINVIVNLIKTRKNKQKLGLYREMIF